MASAVLEAEMYCVKCQAHLEDCKCPDLEERLASIRDHFGYRKCRLCRNHYALCKCPKPEWMCSEEDDSDA